MTIITAIISEFLSNFDFQMWFTASQNPIISCCIQIQIGFYLSGTGLRGCPGKETVKRV